MKEAVVPADAQRRRDKWLRDRDVGPNDRTLRRAEMQPHKSGDWGLPADGAGLGRLITGT
jgi:hypothetical protein